MHDWSGSRIRSDALTVACSFCAAPVGELCVADKDTGRALEAFPAHEVRVRAGLKPQERTE